MITYTYPIASNSPVKTLVARRLQTNSGHVVTCMYMYNANVASAQNVAVVQLPS